VQYAKLFGKDLPDNEQRISSGNGISIGNARLADETGLLELVNCPQKISSAAAG
jgi:hypothetical protein